MTGLARRLVVSYQDSLSSLPLEISDSSGVDQSYETKLALIERATKPGHIHRLVTLIPQRSAQQTELALPQVHAVEVESKASVAELKQALGKSAGVDAERLLLLDIYKGHVYGEFFDPAPVGRIQVRAVR